MEHLQHASSSRLILAEEDEEFYERIEAPKFVDFTIPDRRPDDKTWFCVRIGCDQTHEVVDPDALYRSFKLRVMAARSPNVRFQRAMNLQRSRANTKCPQSAPPKSTKNPISRLVPMNTVPEKMAMTKLKQHPITSLREIPSEKKVKVQTIIAENTTTPMNKSSQAATIVASKYKNVAKDLSLHTPKKVIRPSKTPLSEICYEMKKLNMDGERNRIPQSCSGIRPSKCKESSVAVCSKNCCRKILQVAAHNELGKVEEQKACIDSKIRSNFKGLAKPGKNEARQMNLNTSDGKSRETRPVFKITNDDDKENKSFTCEKRNLKSNVESCETKSSLCGTCDSQTKQEVKIQSKALQGLNLKRTTNPKPFRLRTDERGTLKDANMERRLQAESKKKDASILKHVERIQFCNTKGMAAAARRSRNKSLKIASPKQQLKKARLFYQMPQAIQYT